MRRIYIKTLKQITKNLDNTQRFLIKKQSLQRLYGHYSTNKRYAQALILKKLKLFSPFLYDVFIYFDTTIYCIQQSPFYISIDYKYNICYSTNQFQLYLLITTGLFYFLGDLATVILYLVQAYSISWETLQLSFYIQYRPVLFLGGPCNCHFTFSTGLFYFSGDLATVSLHLVQACSN